MINNKMVLLEYDFLFNPSEAWTNLSDFEKSLADFFSAHGLEAEIIKTVEGQVGKRILLVRKAEELSFEDTSKKPTPKITGKEIADKFRNKEYK